MRDAVSVSTLSTEQLGNLAALNLSATNSVSGTISDNASYGAMASYALTPVLPLTVYGGYQHITYMNPSIDLAPGFDDIGGYVLGAVSNTAYAKGDKILQVYWTGARYAVTPQFTAAIAYYGERQTAYATGADAGCSSTVSGSCNGNLHVASLSLDYHFTKRFDSYAGVMWSNVSHGLAAGYLNTTMIDPTIGLRFSF
jgi:predicted porin